MAAKNPSLYRAIHKMRKGGLHKSLGIPLDETIPKSKIEAATHSKNPHVAAQARMAQTFASFKH